MPVRGRRQNQQPAISPNASGQMVSQQSNFNHRGINKPRAQPQTMPKNKPKNRGKSGTGNAKMSPIQKYLSGDLTYKSQVSDLQRNLENYLTEYRGNKGDVESSFSDTLSKMQRERKRSMNDITEDFAGRGLLHSGLFAKAGSDYNDEFNIRRNELRTDETDQLEDLQTNRNLFKEQTRSVRRNARDEALRRRAQKIGLTGV